MSENKGITLISLVITVAILIILASVGISSGVGILQQSKLNKFTAEMEIMQTEVNELYDRYKDGEDVLSIGKDLDEQANKVFTSEESGISDSTDYKYYDRATIESLRIEGTEGEFYVNVKNRSVISHDGFEYEGETYYTLEQLPNGLYNVEYEDKNSNGPEFEITYGQEYDGEVRISITNIEYNTGYVDKWQVKYKMEGDDYWSTSEDLMFFVNKFGKYTIKIVNGEIESEEKEIDLKAVAQIENRKYITLASAVESVMGEEETTILMIDDTEESVTFPAGKNIILDLSDKTITGTQTNNGQLTIKGQGILKASSTVVSNNGTLNIESGTIQTTVRALTNNASGTATMTGGTLTSSDGESWTVNNYGKFYFKGGNINLTDTGAGTALYNTSGTIYMSGGTITTNGFGLVVDGGSLSGTAGTIISNNQAALHVRNTGTATCTSMTIKQNNSSNSAIFNQRDYSNCVIKSRASNYGISGKVTGKVLATTNTGPGQASENITIYNTGNQYLEFPTWTAKVVNGTNQDDIIWTRSNNSSGTHTITVRKSEHNNETGTYYVHIYVSSASWTAVTMIANITLTF